MKIYLDTVGCRLNQAEIESMARQFRAAGHEITATPQGADLAVINTCMVTARAASDSRGKIRQIARAGAAQIIATGCWATLQPEQAGGLPNVVRVVPNDHKDALVAEFLNLQSPRYDLEPIAREPLPGPRHRTRAFIKVQDGCDNRCTFCITTLARGKGRSRSIGDVISDIQFALSGDSKEIVLTGVHLGSWGQDLGSHLRDLVQAILCETCVSRLRLSSLEPWDLDQEFFSLWKDPRLCQHLHLPLQSGCAATLKRMARKTSPESFRDLVGAAREIMPDVAITTDMITGFPGETESEFRESLDFVREINFAGGHVFSFSPRPGTGAARMREQVGPDVKKRWNHILRDVFEESAKAYRSKFIGQTLPVLWESTTNLGAVGWQLEGHTGNYLRVRAAAPSPRWNEVQRVELKETLEQGLRGEIREVE
jgi:threonylcarbamoyladenosine tRNA methylthiotransferase MtaB